MIKYLYREKYLFLTVFILLFSFLFIKDIDSFLYQREYYSKNVLDYKQVNIFNKYEIINEIPGAVSEKYFNDH